MVRGPNNGSIYIARETLLLAKLFTNAKQEEDSPGKGFLWGILFKKNGAWYFWGVHSEKQVYPILLLFNSALLEYFLDMRKYLVRGPNNGSIYIYTARETLFIDVCKRKILQEKDFFGDIIFKKRGLAFLGYILKKQIYQTLLLFNSALLEYFLDMRKYLVRGPNNGSIYIARETLIYQCLLEEDSPGKGFLWGILYVIKRGLVILGLHS